METQVIMVVIVLCLMIGAQYKGPRFCFGGGREMTATLGAVAVLVLGATLMIGVPSVLASILSRSAMVSTEPGQFSELPHSDHPQAAYLSGFQHGVIDGNSSSSVKLYIDQPKHGFVWHSSEFVKGYVNGYCSIPTNKDVGRDDDRAAFYCPDGPSSAKWFIGKHEPITEGIVVVTYGIPPGGMNVTYHYYDKTSGSSGSDTGMVNRTGEMHFLGYTDELVGFYPGDKVTVSVSKCVRHLNVQCIPQPIIDNKTITLGETGGIVSLDLSKASHPASTPPPAPQAQLRSKFANLPPPAPYYGAGWAQDVIVTERSVASLDGNVTASRARTVLQPSP